MRLKRYLITALLLVVCAAFAEPAAQAQTTTPHGVLVKYGFPTDASSTSIYKLYRANGVCSLTAPPTVVVQQATAVNSIDDPNLPAKTTYCYAVTHTLNGVESVQSNLVTATTLADTNPPSGVTGTAR